VIILLVDKKAELKHIMCTEEKLNVITLRLVIPLDDLLDTSHRKLGSQILNLCYFQNIGMYALHINAFGDACLPESIFILFGNLDKFHT
jgi:hypothetical protein